MKRQFLLYAAARLGSAALQAAALIILARLVSVPEYGKFSTIFAIQSTIFTISLLSIPTYILRELPRSHFAEVHAALRLNIWTSASSALIAAGITLLIDRSISGASCACILALAFLVEKNTEVRQAVCIARGQIVVPCVSLVVRPLLGLLALIFLHDFSGAVVAYVGGRAVGALIGYVVIKHTAVEPADHVMAMPRVLRNVWPMAANSVVTTLVTFDTAIVAVLSTPTQVAFYSSASKIIAPIAIATAALSNVIMPRAAMMSPEEVAGVPRRLIGLGGILVLLIAPAIWFSSFLMHFLFGEAYVGGGAVLAALLLAVPALTIGPLIETLMQAQGQEKAVAMLAVCYTLAAVTAAAIGSLFAGAVGAGLAVLITNTLKVAVQFALVAKKHRRNLL